MASPYANSFQIDDQRVAHPEALRLMRAAHVLLLLLLRKGSGATSGKIFEYMVVGRPVLAIGSGVGAQLVNETGIGLSVDPANIDELAAALRQLALDYAGFRDRYYTPRSAVIDRYERQALTASLVGVFDEVTCNS